MLTEPTRALLRRAIAWAMTVVAVLLALVLVVQWLPRQRSVNTGGGLSSPHASPQATQAAGPASPAGEAQLGSADSSQQDSSPDTTRQTSVKLLIVGDMMFDRDIRLAAERHPDGYDFIFEPLRSLLTDHDLVVGNLEGPVTTFESRSAGSAVGSTDNFLFTFSTKVPTLLARHQIRLVNLGNNHISNFGQEGVAQTQRLLDLARVEYFGCIGQPEFDAERCLRQVEVGGMRILFVNHNQFAEYDQPGVLDQLRRRAAGESGVSSQQPPPDQPPDSRPNQQPDQPLPDQSPPDLTIVYAHWGDEYVTSAGQVIQDQARAYIEAGADLVVGSHPHVVQQRDQYQGAPIYYSLGNFVFDQYFDQNVRRGLALTVEIDPATAEFTLTEHQLELKPNGQTVVTETPAN